LIAAGVVIGSFGVVATGRLVGSLLYGLTASDAGTIAIAVGLLISVALVASLLPAIRASGLDPAKVLRE
jgi:ABC-type antimicrobial peptide transport system permease subunit